MKLMSFQPIWPRGPGMLESLKENALFGNIVAVTWKHPDLSNMKRVKSRGF
jgi:hypothetical protein